jgi:hypothetical protein
VTITASNSTFAGAYGGGPDIWMVNFDGNVTECNYCNNYGIDNTTTGGDKPTGCPGPATLSPYLSGFNPAPPSCGAGGGDASVAPFLYSNTYSFNLPDGGPGCPSGTVGQWDTFGYTVTTPSGSEIKFAVQVSDAGPGPWAPTTGTPPGIQIADVPVDHPGGTATGATTGTGQGPPTCGMTGPSPCGSNCGAVGSAMNGPCPVSCNCPIDLFTPLSSPPPLTIQNAQQPFLQLNADFYSGGSCLGTVAPNFLTMPNGINSCAKDISNAGKACDITTQYTACDQDYHCDLVPSSPTYKKCVWNMGPPSWVDPNCQVAGGGQPGFDLTIEPGCIYGGQNYVPVCNRGGEPVPAGQVIEIWTSNFASSCAQACAGSVGATSSCSYTLPSDLLGGHCIDIPPSAGCSFGTGQRCMLVNPRNTVIDQNGYKECASVAGSNAAVWPQNGTGSGCYNNDSAVKDTPSSCETCGSPITSAIPSMSAWSVTYSCVPSE